MDSLFDKEFAKLTQKYGKYSSPELTQAYSGWNFRDRLLLGFIRASSNNLKHPEIGRLQTARWALFGEKTHGRSDADDDSYSLMVMASWYLLDEAKADKESKFKTRSIRKLAEGVTELDLVGGDARTNIERLRKKFADQKDSLIAAQEEKNIEISTLQLFALEEIERILSLFGVEFYPED